MQYRIFVRHYYPQRDPLEFVKAECPVRVPDRARYATRARAIEESSGVVIGEAWAFCCERDNPDRKRGKDIATGRLFKQLQKEGVL